MKKSLKMFSTLLVGIAVMMMAFGGTAHAAKKKKSVLTDGEKAYVALQITNLMSKHCYYHAAGMHLEELADIWVDENGPNAGTATFSSPAWTMVGIAGIKKYYGYVNEETKKNALEAVSKLYPDIENVEENIGIGHEYAMHTLTTPVIEIAGDGKTAKGIWYSPGIGLSGKINGTSVSYGGTFFWEKYGADFIYENGEWKMWHCQMWYDWTPPFPSSMTDTIGRSLSDMAHGVAPDETPAAPGAGGPGAGGPGPGGDQASQGSMEAGERMSGGQSADMIDNPSNNYETYSITRKPSIEPRFPEPYYTFEETFSY